MTEIEKKDEILKLLTKALIIAIDDDVNLTLRGNRVYVDYGPKFYRLVYTIKTKSLQSNITI